jgi:hypothetical protein
MEDQFVDLTHQNVHDVLTVELPGWQEMQKLQFSHEEFRQEEEEAAE